MARADAAMTTQPWARLSLSGQDSMLSGIDGLPGALPIAPGIERLRREQFPPRLPLAWVMENAIAAIEDELARVPRHLHGLALASDDPAVQAIAGAAGIVGLPAMLGRDAVEHVFARLSAVALGRPAASEGLPESNDFIAALLLVRELMHHLDIPAIRVGSG